MATHDTVTPTAQALAQAPAATDPLVATQTNVDADTEVHILFVTLSNIGDAVLTTPTLNLLRQRWPHAKFTISARQKTAPLFLNLPNLARMVIQPEQRTPRARLRYIKTLRATEYDYVVDLKSPWIAPMLRTQYRIVRRTRMDPNEHAAVSHARVVTPHLPAADVPCATLWPTALDIAHARTTLAALRSNGPIVALGPGANWAPKCWPREHFAAMMQALEQRFPDVAFLLLGDRNDQPRCGFLKASGTRVLHVHDRTLNQVAALLAASDFFVGNDSGLGHIAAAMDCPSLSIFGPGNPTRYRPWGPEAFVQIDARQRIQDNCPQVVAARVAAYLMSSARRARPSRHLQAAY